MMDALTRLGAGIDQARPVIANVPVSDYDRPTPCDGWTVRDVINHMIGALTMFRDTAIEGSADPSLFARDLIGDDAAASFDATAAQAIAAWSEPGKMDGTAKLPFGEFPAQFALQLPAMDMVVHTWDIEKATGNPVAWNEELVAETLTFCESTFADVSLRGTDFGSPVPAPEGADTITRLAAYLGRTP